MHRGLLRRRKAWSAFLRRAPFEDRLPTVALANGLGQDLQILFGIDLAARRQRPLLQVFERAPPIRGPLGEFEKATVGLAGIGKRLAFSEFDRQQPLPAPRLRQARGPPLRVGKDVCCLMDDEIGERIMRLSSPPRYVLPGTLVETPLARRK